MTFFPLAAYGDVGGDYVLRFANRGYENRQGVPDKAAEKELDSVELTVKPELPFAVTARIGMRTIEIKGILHRVPNSSSFLVDFSCSQDKGPPLLNRREVNSAIELTVGKIQTISTLRLVGPNSAEENIWTFELRQSKAFEHFRKP